MTSCVYLVRSHGNAELLYGWMGKKPCERNWLKMPVHNTHFREHFQNMILDQITTIPRGVARDRGAQGKKHKWGPFQCLSGVGVVGVQGAWFLLF